MANGSTATRMGKVEWDAVEKELRLPYGYGVEMRVDGHALRLRVVQQKPLRFVIAVYVDGWIKGEWMKRESEIGAKFWHPFQVALFSGPAFKTMEREHGKRFAHRMRKQHPPKVAGYAPYWNSVSAFRRHITKTCTDIRLLGVGGQPGCTPEEQSA